MNNYTEKTEYLIKKFASAFSKQDIDKQFKDIAVKYFDEQWADYKTIEANNKEFRDLRIAVLENGKIKKLFPQIKTQNKDDEIRTQNMLLQFIAFESTALPKFLGKEDYKFEDLTAFMSITYTPLENKSGNENIFSAYFSITLFFFKDGSTQYVVKPTIQYVLTPNSEVNQNDILNLI